jgi:cyclopropane fatty-acyl-phospholipid synthase-like methyltransferase
MTERDAAELLRTPPRGMAQEVLALLDLKGSERILDIGCGGPWPLEVIAQRIERMAALALATSPRLI